MSAIDGVVRCVWCNALLGRCSCATTRKDEPPPGWQRLFEAAPELAEALEGLLRDALENGYDETHQEVRDARAALEKAGVL